MALRGSHTAALFGVVLSILLGSTQLSAVESVSVLAATEMAVVRQAITHTGARWFAGETKFSAMNQQERRRYLGARRAVSASMEEVNMSSRFYSRALPSRMDWRNHQGANWITPVKDQGSFCGSCWAFSTLGAMEAMIAIQANNPDLQLDLSEQFMLSCSLGTCDGWWISTSMQFLESSGTVDERCFAYEQDDTISCGERCSDWSSRVRTINDWSPIVGTVDTIRQALTEGVVVTTLNIYSDLYYYNGGIYEHVWGDYEGGHAVVLVGYDDVEHCWIAKNSWGDDWGEDGYFRILYGDSGIGIEVSVLDYTNPCDDDEDGYQDTSCGGSDCDDNDPRVHPGAYEACDGKDSNCDGQMGSNEEDNDGDGYSKCTDCDDNNRNVHPGKTEICGDGIDNDCSGVADDLDQDGDGHYGLACGGDDCNDGNDTVYGGAPEICDGIDNNCNGSIPYDESDEDGDSWLICAGDCDDDNASAYPGRREICDNGIDDDCDQDVDGEDDECFDVGDILGWAGAALPEEAEAATLLKMQPPSSQRATMVTNSVLYLTVPLMAIGLARYLFRRREKRVPVRARFHRVA